MRYEEFLAELKASQDLEYRQFHKRLLKNDNINVLGVRTPIMKKIAKKYKNAVDELLSFPDEYYEVTFIKLSAVALLTYDKFVEYIDKCVPLIDNWATCDCFAPKCIEKHKDEFLPYIFKYLSEDKEFYQRFALTTLLHFYVEDKYLQILFDSIKKADLNYYYVHMAAAWLIAEILVKHYDKAVEFLTDKTSLEVLDKKTHNKAIQKAVESYRLSDEQKNFLKGIKR
ncbi:MAG: DNA alkylation repair protein [Clostridiales bacterium]|nr:DNA alkylation repair protein [Clostridiales bacterium]